MSSMDKLADQLKSLITESDDRKPKAYDTTAKVVRVEDDVLWVHIPGGIDETPIRKTINAHEGDSVQVRVANGTAWATGNDSSPPTDDRTANRAIAIAENASLIADEARFESRITKDEVDGMSGRISSAETAIEQNAEKIELKANSSDVYTKTVVDGKFEQEVVERNAAIDVTAGEINLEVSKKTDKDHIIATINASTETEGGSAIKIAADKVNVEGAAIFTSGRLSTNSLNNAYDSKGSASTAQSTAVATAKSYTDTKTSDMATNSSVAGTYATKASAIKRTQRIYWRATSASGKPGVNNTWLSTSGTGYANWSLSIPQLTNGNTKYPFLYTAVQTQTIAQQAAGSACTCSEVLLDDTTTVIDGGQIITSSVNTNQLHADAVTADKISAGAITIGKLRCCQVGQSTSTTTNPWYKFASISITRQYGDETIIFDVVSAGGYGQYTNMGQLKAHLRTGTGIVFENAQLQWLTKSTGIVLSNFVLAYKATNGTKVDVELWAKCDKAYSGYQFVVTYEGQRESIASTSHWTLYNTWTAGSQSAITSGYTQIESTYTDSAQETATNYITEISSAGIWVTPYGKKPNDSGGAVAGQTTGTKIDGTGVYIYNAGTEVAKYGTDARVGATGSSHITLDGTNGIKLYGPNGTSVSASIENGVIALGGANNQSGQISIKDSSNIVTAKATYLGFSAHGTATNPGDSSSHNHDVYISFGGFAFKRDNTTLGQISLNEAASGSTKWANFAISANDFALQKIDGTKFISYGTSVTDTSYPLLIHKATQINGDVKATGSVYASSGKVRLVGDSGSIPKWGVYDVTRSGWVCSTSHYSTADAIVNFMPFAVNYESGSANMRITTSGYVHKASSSSRRYKTNIDDLIDYTIDADKLYDIRVAQFEFREDYLSSGSYHYHKLIPGFIAEEIEETYPIATEYDDEDRPEDWNVKCIVPPMLKLIQDHKKKIDELEARIEVLERG